MKEKKLSFSNDSFVLMALFRYALGRQTYAPGIAVENIIRNWDKLKEFHKKQIKEEINIHKEEVKKGLYPILYAYDSEWDKVLELI